MSLPNERTYIPYLKKITDKHTSVSHKFLIDSTVSAVVKKFDIKPDDEQFDEVIISVANGVCAAIVVSYLRYRLARNLIGGSGESRALKGNNPKNSKEEVGINESTENIDVDDESKVAVDVSSVVNEVKAIFGDAQGKPGVLKSKKTRPNPLDTHSFSNSIKNPTVLPENLATMMQTQFEINKQGREDIKNNKTYLVHTAFEAERFESMLKSVATGSSFVCHKSKSTLDILLKSALSSERIGKSFYYIIVLSDDVRGGKHAAALTIENVNTENNMIKYFDPNGGIYKVTKNKNFEKFVAALKEAYEAHSCSYSVYYAK